MPPLQFSMRRPSFLPNLRSASYATYFRFTRRRTRPSPSLQLQSTSHGRLLEWDNVKRRLFNLAAAVSLVLCAATVSLWWRSYIYEDTWALDLTRSSTIWVTTRTGAFTLSVVRCL